MYVRHLYAIAAAALIAFGLPSVSEAQNQQSRELTAIPIQKVTDSSAFDVVVCVLVPAGLAEAATPTEMNIRVEVTDGSLLTANELSLDAEFFRCR